MQRMFEKFTGDEMGNTLIDWTVLVAGAVLMGLSVVLTVTAGDITDASAERIEAPQTHLPG